jgi:hypothetical protein
MEIKLELSTVDVVQAVRELCNRTHPSYMAIDVQMGSDGHGGVEAHVKMKRRSVASNRWDDH